MVRRSCFSGADAADSFALVICSEASVVVAALFVRRAPSAAALFWRRGLFSESKRSMGESLGCWLILLCRYPTMTPANNLRSDVLRLSILSFISLESTINKTCEGEGPKIFYVRIVPTILAE